MDQPRVLENLVRRTGEPETSGGSLQRRNDGMANTGPGAALSTGDNAANGAAALGHPFRQGALHPPQQAPRMVAMEDQPREIVYPPRSAMPPREKEEPHLRLLYRQTTSESASWALAAWNMQVNTEQGLPTCGIDYTMYSRAPRSFKSFPGAGNDIPASGGGSFPRGATSSPSRAVNNARPGPPHSLVSGDQHRRRAPHSRPENRDDISVAVSDSTSASSRRNNHYLHPGLGRLLPQRPKMLRHHTESNTHHRHRREQTNGWADSGGTFFPATTSTRYQKASMRVQKCTRKYHRAPLPSTTHAGSEHRRGT